MRMMRGTARRLKRSHTVVLDLCHVDGLRTGRLKIRRMLYFDFRLSGARSPVLSKHGPAVVDWRENA